MNSAQIRWNSSPRAISRSANARLSLPFRSSYPEIGISLSIRVQRDEHKILHRHSISISAAQGMTRNISPRFFFSSSSSVHLRQFLARFLGGSWTFVCLFQHSRYPWYPQCAISQEHPPLNNSASCIWGWGEGRVKLILNLTWSLRNFSLPRLRL